MFKTNVMYFQTSFKIYEIYFKKYSLPISEIQKSEKY